MSTTVNRLSIVQLPLSDIDTSGRMRRDMGNIDELADSIHINGILHPPAVIKRGDHYKLIAGGRRTAAYTLLADRYPDKYSLFDFCVVKDDYSAADLSLLELEENIQRKEMDWKDKAIGIADIHQKYQRKSHRERQTWTQKHTGDLLGQAAASVSNALVLADALKRDDKEVWACETAKDALQLLLKRKQKEIAKIRDQRAKDAIAARAANKTADNVLVVPTDEALDSPPAVVDIFNKPTPTPTIETYTPEYVYANVRQGDSILYMQTTREMFNGIYTDIPYGVDVDNFKIKNIDVTTAEHDRDENIALFEPFLRGAYRVLLPESFLVFWYDIEHTTLLQTIARDVGFRVLRWSMLAPKPNAKNEAAAYNPTKDYETVMVCAKQSATLHTRRPTSIVPWKWNIKEREQYQHPFSKPQSAHRYLLETFFPSQTTLFDPFCGEGSGLLAMQSMNYRFVGMDLVEQHVVRARQHLSPNH